MRHLYLFAHYLGLVLWMGGAFSALAVGIAMRSAAREDLPVMLRILGRLHRALILPGVVLVVITGLLLTLQLYGSATSAAGFPRAMMVMQGAGMVAAVIALTVNLPAVARLGRIEPTGEYAPLFAALQTRAAVSGQLSGLLAIIALIAGVMLR